MHDWRRIGEPAGLDHDARERSNGATIAPLQHVGERLDEVTTHFAAEAAGLQLDQAVRARFHEIVVEADLPELIDDHGRARELRLAKDMSQQRRLAAAEKAGEDQNAYHCDTGGKAAMRTRLIA